MTAPSAATGEADLVVRAGRVITDQGEVAAEVSLRNGRISRIDPPGRAPVGRMTVDLRDDEILIPGLVDTHVHVNEPGRTEWEGFWTATRAAAAGGVTTIVDMPLNSLPPTLSVSALEAKRAAAATKAFVDVGFWGGAVPGNGDQLRPLHDAGVFGFKGFLLDSGVSEFPALKPHDLVWVMAEIVSFDGLFIVHAEDAGEIGEAPSPSGPSYRGFLLSRPAAAEVTAVAEVIKAVRHTGCRTHIVHVSSAEVLPLIAEAKAEGLPITVETCPHYLSLSPNDVPDGSTEFKCCPPIRGEQNRERLWQSLRSGLIDMVVSDHSPATAELKQTGDFGTAWGGVSSLQLGLSIVWTEARRRGISLADVVGWMSAGPARSVELPRKGRIAVGCDADFAVFAPDESFRVHPDDLLHRHHVTPYAGRTLQGRVRSSWLQGRRIDLTAPPAGHLISRSGTAPSHQLSTDGSEESS